MRRTACGGVNLPPTFSAFLGLFPSMHDHEGMFFRRGSQTRELLS